MNNFSPLLEEKRKLFLDAGQAQVSFFNSVQVPSAVNDEVHIIHQYFVDRVTERLESYCDASTKTEKGLLAWLPCTMVLLNVLLVSAMAFIIHQ